jgi:glycerol-3-phosphate acyltransferase PlsX
MGGDHAPGEIVRGAVEAARSDPDLRVLLVGRENLVREELGRLSWNGDRISTVQADEVVSMADSPVEALRKNRGSSIEVAYQLVKAGRADAVLSAGNTGVCVAAATLLLGKLPEVARAGIAVVLPAGDQPVVVIDVGANVSPKVQHLLQYGMMASLYASEVLQLRNPRVGLLNVGAETEKGHSLAKVTNAEFRKSNLNFVGNVEGGEIFQGKCEVVVCDGFVGNVVLKVAEGLAERLIAVIQSRFQESIGESLRKNELLSVLSAAGASGVASGDASQAGKNPSRAGSSGMEVAASIEGVLTESFARLKQRFDYAEYGGAPLLGVNGVSIIAHGRSDARAIASAVRVAKKMVVAQFNQHITDAIRRSRLTGQEDAAGQGTPESRRENPATSRSE